MINYQYSVQGFGNVGRLFLAALLTKQLIKLTVEANVRTFIGFTDDYVPALRLGKHQLISL